jgi:hypothetical protein
MNKILRFVVWICSKFNKKEIEQIVIELTKILANQNPEIKPKDHFKEEHPNYRDYEVDPIPPVKKKSKNKYN